MIRLLKHNILTIFFISFLSYSQNYKRVDSLVKKYPSFKSTTKLTEQINKDFTNDFDKVRAIYDWLTTNITYDITEKGAVSFSYYTVDDYKEKNNKKIIK